MKLIFFITIIVLSASQGVQAQQKPEHKNCRYLKEIITERGRRIKVPRVRVITGPKLRSLCGTERKHVCTGRVTCYEHYMGEIREMIGDVVCEANPGRVISCPTAQECTESPVQSVRTENIRSRQEAILLDSVRIDDPIEFGPHRSRSGNR